MTHRHRTSPRAAALLGLAGLGLLAGCNEFNITGWDLSDVAVTAGDFDNVAEPLDRMVVPHRVYEGIISTATWDPSYDYEQVQYKVEDLLGSYQNMTSFSVIFVASGTRGLGDRQYNALEPDDQLISSDVVIDNTQRFVEEGGVLVATDWAYDLVEQSWPEYVRFVGDESQYDAAQLGEIGRVAADLVDDEVVDALGFDEMGVHYNYSNWAVIDDVDADTRVVVRGSIQYRTDDGIDTLQDVPLLVVFQPQGARGKVVFSTFHLDAQNANIIDPMIETVVGSFSTDGGGTVAVE